MWNIPIPFTNYYLPVPKRMWGMLFGTSVEAVLDWSLLNDPRAAKEWIGAMIGELSVFDTPVDMVPNTFRVPLELWANKKSFTGKKIVSDAMQQLPVEERYNTFTPEIYKSIGRHVGIAPVQLEAAANGYFGGTARNLSWIADEAAGLVGFYPNPSEDWGTWLSKAPVGRALFSPTPIGLGGAHIEEFEELRGRLENVARTTESYVKGEDDDNSSDLQRYLGRGNNSSDYKWYLNNKTAINYFLEFKREVVYLRQYAIKEYGKEGAAEKVSELQGLLNDVAIEFNLAYKSGTNFDVPASIKEVLKNRKDRKEKDSNKLQNFRK